MKRSSAIPATAGAAPCGHAPDDRCGNARESGNHTDYGRAASGQPAGCHRPYSDGRRRAIAGCRSEEHTSELQSLMRISYAVFCLKKKKTSKYTTRSNMQMNI